MNFFSVNMSTEIQEDEGKLCSLIMEANKFARYVAVCDADAKILWESHRNDVDNIFTLEETKENLKRAINTWRERYALSEKAGRGRYAIVSYDKIKRVTMPLKNGHLLFVSIQGDKPANWGDLLKIVDYVEEHPSQQ
jgi:hypothetical protein